MFGGSGLSGAGVGFQPGSGLTQEQYERQRAIGGSGVQEAIRILSLRLPRVMGAQGAIAPATLLQSEGSAGNPMIDRVLERAWQRVMGTGGPNSPQPAAPVLPAGGDQSGTMPNFQTPVYPGARREATSIDRGAMPYRPPSPPRIIPGDQPEPPREPIFETPLPAPHQPGPDHLPSDPLAGWPNRYDA